MENTNDDLILVNEDEEEEMMIKANQLKLSIIKAQREYDRINFKSEARYCMGKLVKMKDITNSLQLYRFKVNKKINKKAIKKVTEIIPEHTISDYVTTQGKPSRLLIRRPEVFI